MINFGLVGKNWGKNYLRVIDPKFMNLKYLCCRDIMNFDNGLKQILAPWEASSPDLGYTQNFKKICHDEEIDLIILAADPNRHFEMAKEAIECGKHVVVEKPFCFKLEEAWELWELLRKHQTMFMIDYIHLFQPGFQTLRNTFHKSEMHNWSHFNIEIHATGDKTRETYTELYDYGSHAAALAIALCNDDPMISHFFRNQRLQKRINDFEINEVQEIDEREWIVDGKYKNKDITLFYSSNWTKGVVSVDVRSGENELYWEDKKIWNPLKNFMEQVRFNMENKIPITNIDCGIRVTDILNKIEKNGI